MDVLMPQLGETVTEGTIAAWHKQVGDRVAADEILLDVETDKVSMEIPAPRAGRLAKILVETGQTVGVGTVLAVIEAEGEAATAKKEDREPTPSKATDAPSAAAAPATERSAPSPAAPKTVAAVASPAHISNPSALERSDIQRLSPAVRRLVAEHQLDVQTIAGTGRNGRVTRRNVVDYLGSRGAEPKLTVEVAPAAAPRAATAPSAEAQVSREAPSAPASPRPAAVPPPAPAPRTTVPFSRIRRLTAEHMVKSKATSPHVLQAVEVDFSGVDRVRKAVRESWRAQHGFSLTYLPFIAHAVCAALREFPKLNSTVKDDALLLHAHVNLAIAVDLGAEGLVAPVIKRAESLSVTELASAIQDIATRARSNKLKPDDFAGGTYTLSNSGTFGTLITAPIINQPQVAILSTDGVRKKPVVVEHPDGDSIAIRPIGILAQSFDHRAVDGAYSAAFLDRTRKLIELTDWFREI
jgi:pyruvate dehydrogenase E2 component (dihydrolipoamide acetyltransferase)